MNRIYKRYAANSINEYKRTRILPMSPYLNDIPENAGSFMLLSMNYLYDLFYVISSLLSHLNDLFFRASSLLSHLNDLFFRASSPYPDRTDIGSHRARKIPSLYPLQEYCED